MNQQIFSDTVARPATTCLKCVKSDKAVLLIAALRLFLAIPAFFLYIAPGGGNFVADNLKSDVGFCVAIGIFSFFSGYLVTNAFQIAPTTVPPAYKAQVANMCSVSFQTAFAAALVTALLLRMALFPSAA